MRLPKAEKSGPDAETSLIFISPRFSMTGWFGSRLVVIPNLVRDLGFGSWVLKPRAVGRVPYLLMEDHRRGSNLR
jgi:hypothetical protein